MTQPYILYFIKLIEYNIYVCNYILNKTQGQLNFVGLAATKDTLWFSDYSSILKKIEKMIHTTLPMKPRNGRSNYVYLLGPLSVLDQPEGRHVLSITGLKSSTPDLVTEEYINLLNRTVGMFDSIYLDYLDDFKDYIKYVIKTLPIQVQDCTLTSCSCGSYEEVSGARCYNLTRVIGGHCIKCGSFLKNKRESVLTFNHITENIFFAKMYPVWVEKDFKHFLSRQEKSYILSKNNEQVKILFKDHEFGIRYQFIWALFLKYITEKESDTEITLHYVNKVQDKVFLVALLAKMIFPELQISFHALPVILTTNLIEISSCGASEIDQLRKGLRSRRKEVSI